MLIDSHCHLDFDVFTEALPELIKHCHQKNITRFVIPSIGKQNWDKVIELSKQHSEFIPALGIHPCFITGHNLNTDALQLEQYIHQYEINILGEIGLDKRIKENLDTQLAFFTEQIRLAQKLNIPALIHSVKAHSEVISTLKSINFSSGGIIHAFNGSVEVAQAYIEFGFKLGIGGLITYPQNKRLIDVVSSLPLTSFVLETDSPDMPVFNQDRSQPNTPLNLIQIFNDFCRYRKECREEIENTLWHNTQQILQL